jgi:apolipoprotein D and lipocalin family protein
MRKLPLLICLLLGSCAGLPEGVRPVQNFTLERFLGTWYEIARLDHSFERGLSRVTAEYSLNDDGTVKVVNRGFSEQRGTWKSAEGKARFVESEDLGYLKVSFFGPFYGSYIVAELDEETYRYALISGPNKDYLWLLARTPTIETAVKTRLIAKAKDLGFAVENLIYVDHDL